MGFAVDAGRAMSRARSMNRTMSRAPSMALPSGASQPAPSSSDMDLVGLEEWPGIPQGQVQLTASSARLRHHELCAIPAVPVQGPQHPLISSSLARKVAAHASGRAPCMLLLLYHRHTKAFSMAEPLADRWRGLQVLLGPQACRSAWQAFMTDSARHVQQAIAVQVSSVQYPSCRLCGCAWKQSVPTQRLTGCHSLMCLPCTTRRGLTGFIPQDMRKATSSKMPPLWAIAGLIILGFNEFLTVLYNPLLLFGLLMLGAFAFTVYKCALLPRCVHENVI